MATLLKEYQSNNGEEMVLSGYKAKQTLTDTDMVNSKALTHTLVWLDKSGICRASWRIQVRLHVVILRPKSTGQASRLEFQTGFLYSSPKENSFLFGKPQSLLI